VQSFHDSQHCHSLDVMAAIAKTELILDSCSVVLPFTPESRPPVRKGHILAALAVRSLHQLLLPYAAMPGTLAEACVNM